MVDASVRVKGAKKSGLPKKATAEILPNVSIAKADSIDYIYEASKRCPKGIKNGPCGAVHEGRCELGGICAWADAYIALEKEGKKDLLKDVAGTEKFDAKEGNQDAGLLVGSTISQRYKPKLKSAAVAEDEKNGRSPFGKKFAVTCEVDPPHGTKTDKMKAFLSALPEIDGVNIVDNPLGKPVMSGALPALLVKKYGKAPIYQVTCRAKNIEAIQSDLFSAYACGARHVLALTGDYVQSGVKPVFEIDSTILSKLLRTKLAIGKDFFGNPLDAPVDFYVGVAANPNATPLGIEVTKFEKKMKFADFAQTQAVFDMELLEKFAGMISCPEKVLVGILPLKDAAMASKLSAVPGIKMPPALMAEIAKEPDAGIAIAKEMAKKAKKLGFGGIHIMPMMDAALVKEIAG